MSWCELVQETKGHVFERSRNLGLSVLAELSRNEGYTHAASVECISDTVPPGPSSISGLHISRELGNGLVLL